MKASGIVALSLLGLAVAAPHKHHQQPHKAKRDLVWVTEIAEVVETVVQTTTVWVDAEDMPATTAPTTTEEVPVYTPAPEPTTTEAVPEPTTTEEAPATTETPSSSSVYTPPPAPTTTETPSSTYTPPPALTTTEAPTSTYVAPPAPETTSSSTSSAVVAAETASTGSSASGQVFSPTRVTYYNPGVGLGSCGETYPDSSNVVALSYKNYTPDLCGKKLTIEVNGKKFPAFVGDRCPGCEQDNLDLSEGLFVDIMGSTYAGVITDAKWWWDN
ncbi:Barwin-related endoglucanase [Macrophomina phaseolina MS6]|uniref:Barwin-related endoglucanase n=1 Tax=Macrophomina phaseolina (strain MS6) TaxID=1126212 RepID=K2RFU3_MACPH|nr:Barwin-related endoglucanase [Macrophomina phaseolina MS6]